MCAGTISVQVSIIPLNADLHCDPKATELGSASLRATCRVRRNPRCQPESSAPAPAPFQHRRRLRPSHLMREAWRARADRRRPVAAAIYVLARPPHLPLLTARHNVTRSRDRARPFVRVAADAGRARGCRERHIHEGDVGDRAFRQALDAHLQASVPQRDILVEDVAERRRGGGVACDLLPQRRCWHSRNEEQPRTTSGRTQQHRNDSRSGQHMGKPSVARAGATPGPRRRVAASAPCRPRSPAGR